MPKSVRLTWNAPVVLTCALVSLAVTLIVVVTNNAALKVVALKATANFRDVFFYTGLAGYSFAHSDWSHFLSNMALLVLIGPILEEKYGARRLLEMMVVTVLVTAVLFIAFFDGKGLIGASGVVFMLIILASFANFRRGEIPVTFILVVLVFVGREVVNSLQDNQVSEFAHIVGGACGAAFGFFRT